MLWPSSVSERRTRPQRPVQTFNSHVAARAVDDEAVSRKSRWRTGMPSFRTTLSDRDRSRPMTYLRSGTCCREEHIGSEPWYRAAARIRSKRPLGWRARSGAHREGGFGRGVGVQLIAPNSVRTTVYTNDKGALNFVMQAGTYTSNPDAA